MLQFGFSMLKGTAVKLDEERIDESDTLKNRVFRRYQQIFIPIGVPVIAGPGAITTAIIYGYQSETLLTHIFLSLTVVGVLGVLHLENRYHVIKRKARQKIKDANRCLGQRD